MPDVSDVTLGVQLALERLAEFGQRLDGARLRSSSATRTPYWARSSRNPLPRRPKLDLSAYTAPQIAAAILALQDRRAALTRTLVNQALEARHGRRNGHCGGSPALGNGALHQLEL